MLTEPLIQVVPTVDNSTLCRFADGLASYWLSYLMGKSVSEVGVRIDMMTQAGECRWAIRYNQFDNHRESREWTKASIDHVVGEGLQVAALAIAAPGEFKRDDDGSTQDSVFLQVSTACGVVIETCLPVWKCQTHGNIVPTQWKPLRYSKMDEWIAEAWQMYFNHKPVDDWPDWLVARWRAIRK